MANKNYSRTELEGYHTAFLNYINDQIRALGGNPDDDDGWDELDFDLGDEQPVEQPVAEAPATDNAYDDQAGPQSAADLDNEPVEDWETIRRRQWQEMMGEDAAEDEDETPSVEPVDESDQELDFGEDLEDFDGEGLEVVEMADTATSDEWNTLIPDRDDLHETGDAGDDDLPGLEEDIPTGGQGFAEPEIDDGGDLDEFGFDDDGEEGDDLPSETDAGDGLTLDATDDGGDLDEFSFDEDEEGDDLLTDAAGDNGDDLGEFAFDEGDEEGDDLLTNAADGDDDWDEFGFENDGEGNVPVSETDDGGDLDEFSFEDDEEGDDLLTETARDNGDDLEEFAFDEGDEEGDDLLTETTDEGDELDEFSFDDDGESGSSVTDGAGEFFFEDDDEEGDDLLSDAGDDEGFAGLANHYPFDAEAEVDEDLPDAPDAVELEDGAFPIDDEDGEDASPSLAAKPASAAKLTQMSLFDDLFVPAGESPDGESDPLAGDLWVDSSDASDEF